VAAKVSDLKRRRPLGRTLLFDSIHQVLNDFPKLQFGDAIFLVSDGADNESKTPVVQLRKELINRGIRVFLFLIVQDEFQSFEETEGIPRTQDLALSTGGAVVPISWAEIVGANRAPLDKVAPLIRAQVESFYSLELRVCGSLGSGRVKVSFADKKQKKNSILAFSHQVDLCPAAIGAGN
jgi:hypothetical protein